MKRRRNDRRIAHAALGAALAASLYGCGGPQGSASEAEESVIENPHGSALEIGRGFDSHSSSTKGKCVELGATETRGGTASQQVSFEVREVNSFQSLAKLMSLSGSGSFGSGIYSTSASFKFFESSDFTTYNTYLMVHVKVVNTDVALKEHVLTAGAKQALAAGPDAFHKVCGDSFVSQRSEGGEFYAVVSFKSKSEDHKREIVSKVRAHGGLWSASGTFQESMSALSQIAETDVEIIRYGGVGALPDFSGDQDYDGLVSYALGFPDVVKPQGGKPWVIGYTVESFDIVPGFSVPTPDYTEQREAIERLAEIKLTQRSYANRVQYILQNEAEFAGVDAPALQQASNQYNANLNAVGLQAKKCLSAPQVDGNCAVPTNLAMPVVIWPVWKVGGATISDRCEAGRRWARKLGIIDAELHRELALMDWTVYFNSSDPHSGFANMSRCDETPEAFSHLPKELP